MLNRMRILMEGNDMRRSLLCTTVMIFCLTLCPLSLATEDIDINILLLNTEYFFDDQELDEDPRKRDAFKDLKKLKKLAKPTELTKIQKLMERKEPMKIRELMKIEELTQEQLELIQEDFEKHYKDLKKSYEKLYELQAYLTALRRAGTPVSIPLVLAAATGLVVAKDRTILKQYGGHLELKRS